MIEAHQNSDLRWRFLKDGPIKTDEDDCFKIHSAYASSLLDIIRTCDETPFAIGLFGGWGIGKTTIIKLLEHQVKDHNRYKWLYLDVWKFSREPLKRWVLLETRRQLSGQSVKFDEKYKEEDLRKNLYDEETLKEEMVTLKLGALIKKTRFWVLLIIGVVLILFGLFPPSFIENFNVIIQVLGSMGIIASFSPKLFEWLLSSTFKKEIKYRKTLPAFSAETFEMIFRNMVREVLGNLTNGKLIITLDNLDRCSDETAMETLSVIKTFLDITGCIYIVPCDEEALVDHIIKSQAIEDSKTDQDRTIFAREFLRKFFQVTLRIPHIPEFDREQFIDDQLKEANLSLSPEARDIVAIAYGGKTPRQIKRFINDFIGYLILVKVTENEGLLPLGELTENLDFLAKMIVVYIEWPDFLDHLIEDPEVLNEWTERMRTGEEIEQMTYNQMIKKGNPNKRLLEFLEATRDIELPPDLRPYLYLKRVDYEKDTKLAHQVRESLKKGDEAFFIEMLEKEDKNIEKIFRIALDAAKEWLRGKRPILINNAIRVFLKTVERVPKVMKGEIVSLTKDLLRDVFLREEATRIPELFDENQVFKFCRNLNLSQRESILDKYVDLFDSSIEGKLEYMEIYEKIIKERDILSSMQKEKVKEMLTQRYAKEENNTLNLIRIIAAVRATQDFINVQLPLDIMEKFTVSPDAQNKDRFETYLSIKDFASPEVKEGLTSKIKEAIDFSRTEEIDPTNEFALEILSKLKPKDLDRKESEDLYPQLRDQMSNKEVPNQSPWANALLHLRSAFNEDQQIELEDNMVKIMEHPDVDEVISFLDDLGEESCQIMLTLSKVKTAIRDRTPQLDQQSKKQMLEKFPMNTLAKELFEIIHPEVDWDVTLGYEILKKAYGIGKLTPKGFSRKLKKFLNVLIKDKLAQRSAELEKIVTSVEGDKALSRDEALINLLIDYVIKFMKLNVEKASGLFNTLLTHIPDAKKSEEVLIILDRYVKGKVIEGKSILENIVYLTEKHETLKKKGVLEPLADHVFELIKQDVEKGCELFRKLFPFMPENMKKAYAKELTDNLLSYEAQGQPMAEFQGLFDLLKNLQEFFDKSVWNKVMDLADRLSGPAKPDEEKQLILEFLRSLEKIPDDEQIKKRIVKLKKRTNLGTNAAAKVPENEKGEGES